MNIQNPWRELFSVDRQRCPLTWDYLRENKDYPCYLLKRMLSGASDTAASSLLCGEGKILWHQGRKTAAYRDPQGTLTLLSPVCPHLGCVVCWNVTEKTWDCPCHGSRFNAKGEVRAGPAEQPLSPVS